MYAIVNDITPSRATVISVGSAGEVLAGWLSIGEGEDHVMVVADVGADVHPGDRIWHRGGVRVAPPIETFSARLAVASPGDRIMWADERTGDDAAEDRLAALARRRGYLLAEDHDGDLVLADPGPARVASGWQVLRTLQRPDPGVCGWDPNVGIPTLGSWEIGGEPRG